MIFIETKLQGVFIVELERLDDERGFFARSYCEREFAARDISFRVAQCDISFNRQRGTLRGMHFQTMPFPEAKLVSCRRGKIFDVVIDLRRNSPTFKQWLGVELTEENGKALYIPTGFAHGFQSLSENVEVFYVMSEFYHAECTDGVRWNDPAFGITWPLPVAAISNRDAGFANFEDRSVANSNVSVPQSIQSEAPSFDTAQLCDAWAQAGMNSQLRGKIFDALRQTEQESTDAERFRSSVRLPIISSLLSKEKWHRVVLQTGLAFDVGLDSRIEQALLLSASAHPDHVWEPQTTRLLVALGSESRHVIVGGAYIGDQILLIAQAMKERSLDGIVHAFEPMMQPFARLLHHLEINRIANVKPQKLALWDASHVPLNLTGVAALASSVPVENGNDEVGDVVPSITIDQYIASNGLSGVGLIMLDIEGGEEKALLGARETLSLPFPEAPHLVFEVHRSYVDWSNGLEQTAVVRFVVSLGYTVFAIRDFHSNYSMVGKAIEIIPIDSVYLEGPPHGFNLLATKDPDLVRRLGLRIVANVSPKLLAHKDPALHHPLEGL